MFLIIGGAIAALGTAALLLSRGEKCRICHDSVKEGRQCHKCPPYKPLVCGKCSELCKVCFKYTCKECLEPCDKCASRVCCLDYLGFYQLTEACRPKPRIVCKTCEKSFSKDKTKYDAAVLKSDRIETWSKNYKGKIPHSGKQGLSLTSDWSRSKEKALSQLTITAAYKDRSMIKEVEYEKSTGSDGNYKFTTWRATGIAT